MQPRLFQILVGMAFLALLLATGSPAASAQNPCNPCGAKAANPCNPCGGAKAENPCNPCGGAKTDAQATVALNPCHAKNGIVFHVGDPAGRDTITFTSRAPLEDIVGTTNKIGGYLVFNPNKPRDGGYGKFVVPVASLNTGIPLRDEHLRSDQWFNAEQYPEITFEIEDVKKIEEVRSTDNFSTYEVEVIGPLTIHGQTKQITAPGRITFMKESPQTQEKMPGNLLAARAAFNVALSDFGITAPPGTDLIGTKVSDTISVEVSMIGSDELKSAGNPCNPCAKNPCNPCGAKNPCNPCGGKAANPCNPCAK